MSTSCSYGVAGSSIGNASTIKSNYHIIDLTLSQAGMSPDNGFATQCRDAGMSAIFANANDQGGGGGDLAGYQNLKGAGWMAAGGETNSDDEINTVMDAGLVYIDYAGWTGPDSLRSIYSEGIVAHDGGLAAWFETYGSNDGAGVPYSTSGITPDVMANMASQAHSAGAKEVGLLAGNWNIDWGAGPYSNLATAIENEIGSFGGFLVWRGYDGVSCDQTASDCASLFSALQSSWPAQTTATIDTRVAGSGGGGGGGGGGGSPGTGSTFSGLTEIDIMDFATKAHNGQVTPGTHMVTIYLQGTSGTVNTTVRPREYQPGTE